MEAHERTDVEQRTREIQEAGQLVRSRMPFHVSFLLHEGDSDVGAAKPAGAKAVQKVVHFVRHGEGKHNVAQREWRADPDWDGESEPYTLETDSAFFFVDAQLTPRGQEQARELRQRSAKLSPELMCVSPMRRATETGLLAFPLESHPGLPVVAHELLHEHAGKHTCDKRLARSELAAAFPAVDYSALEAEEDPFWGDGRTRETWEELTERAAAWLAWLKDAPQRSVMVASHSGWLLCAFNGAMVPEGHVDAAGGPLPPPQPWFGTGEMRTAVLTFQDA